MAETTKTATSNGFYDDVSKSNESQGVFIVGDYLKLTQSTSRETGEVSHHVNLLVDLGESISTIKIKTKQPEKWAKITKSALVKIRVNAFTPKDSSAIYYSEI